MKKKLVCLALIVYFILSYSFAIISNGAGTDVAFSVSSMNAQKGENITTIVNMNCTTSFSAANLVLNYDSDVLEYVPYYDGNNAVDYNQNCGDAIKQSGVPIGTVLINSNTPGTIKIGYMSTSSVAGKSGEFLKFKFKVKNNATNGNSNVTLSATTLKGGDGTNLNAEFTGGVVSILSAITMNNSSMNMIVGNINQLSIYSTSGTIFNEVTWTSSNNSVASVTANTDSKTANVTANSAGSATITATVGGVSTTSVVTVTEPDGQYTLSINDPVWTFLPASQKRTLNVSFNPSSSATGKTITWSSSNTNIATINSSTGEITAISNGTTTITANDGNKTSTYTLTVNKTLGDIDEDTNITAYDAYRALALYADQASGSTVNENEVVMLDVEKNGDMSSNDAYLILKYSVGLINNF